MSFVVYDYRTVNRNVLVTPEIRARLYHMQPGQVDSRHSHDLGHEVFLILEGQAEFTINGATQVLGPGQLCVALADEIHQVRNLLGDKPTIMYLSVTPHIQPTHTDRNADDTRQPPHFKPNQVYQVESDLSISIEELLDCHVAAAESLRAAIQTSTGVQSEMAALFKRALADGDQAAANAARDAMWAEFYTVYKRMSEWGEIWNEWAARTVDSRR